MNNHDHQISDIWKKDSCSFNAYFAASRISCIYFESWQYKDHFLSHTKRSDNLNEIIKELPEKDLIFLESSIFQDLSLFSVQSGKFICKYTTYPNYVLDLQKDPDFLMDNLSSKSRSTLKRKIKNLKKAFGEDWDVFSPKTGDEMHIFLDRAAKLSEKTYQHKLFDDGIPNDDIFREKMYQAAESDAVRASLLRINGEDAAYILCPSKDNILIYDFVGYHPDYQNHSVGIILQWLMLSELMEEKNSIFLILPPVKDSINHNFHQTNISVVIFLFRLSFPKQRC